MLDTKELIKKCTQMLNLEQQTENDGNMAQSPVILLFLGEVAANHMQHVKNTLDANFKNGDYIPYLYLYYEENVCRAKNIFTGAEYECVEEAIHEASLGLLGTDEAIFHSKKEIYFECLLSSQEELAEKYYEEYLKLHESHNYNMVKTLYLMLDQESRASESQAQKLIDRVRAEEKQSKENSNIYILSNLLYDGSILREDRIWQNYRLVSDLILLGNTADSSVKMEAGQLRSYSRVVHDGVMTAAYSFVGKPLEDITKISLYHLMKKLYQQEAGKAYAVGEAGAEERIKQRLDIKSVGISFIESLFQNHFAGKLPNYNIYQWLPWNDSRGYKRFQKKRNTDWQEINQMTGGVLDAYFEMNYTNVLDQEIEDNSFVEECRQKIHDFLLENFPFFEFIECLKDGQWKSLLRNIVVNTVAAGGDAWVALVGKQAVQMLGKLFHQWAVNLLINEMQVFYDRAVSLKEGYEKIVDEVHRELMNFDSEHEQMDRFYENEVEKFLSSDEFHDYSRLHPLFRADATLEEVLNHVCFIFEMLIRYRAIYREPFEKEQETRLENVSELERTQIIKSRLSANVGNQGRLLLNYDYREDRAGTFCLVNSQSVYIDELKEDERRRLFTLFDLNRRDCLEMVELYKIEKLDQIILKN